MNASQTIYYSRFTAPIGPLLVAVTDRGLRYLQFGHQVPSHCAGESWTESPKHTAPYEEQITAYFRGELREFTCKLDLVGTPFQKRCWEALMSVPYGATCSYADIARKVGSPKAFRAVGQANHINPVPIIVPCHRIVGSNGSLTGYGGGLATKEALLRLEGIAVPAGAERPQKRVVKPCMNPSAQTSLNY